jgi:serine-type D-Ala-D-Ala carboxypeptidase (penicillin-binding protein 5/6)
MRASTPVPRRHRRAGLTQVIAILAIASGHWAIGGSVGATSASGAGAVGGPRLAGTRQVVDRPADVPAPPKFAATSWVLADLSTGEVIAAKGAHRPGLPASTLKTLTVLTALPVLDPDARVLAQPGDIVDGTKVGLVPGSGYSVRQLLEGTMLSSGNDAATALARAAGGVRRQVTRMQTEADSLGAFDTVVRNPSGLDAPGQVTSAYDLALIARAAMARPDLRALVATRSARFPGKQTARGPRTGYQIQNHNRLLANYPGAIGVKNGYTERARWTSVGAADRGGRTYLLTALHRGDGSWRSEAAMFDWAFRYGARVRPVGRLVDRGEATRGAGAGNSGASQAGSAGSTTPVAADDPGAGRTLLRSGAAGVGTIAGGCAIGLLALRARMRRRRR